MKEGGRFPARFVSVNGGLGSDRLLQVVKFLASSGA
jgi:hypothetical protein